MRVVIQRGRNIEVLVESKGKMVSNGELEHGLVVLLGIEESDSIEDVDYLVKKTLNLRIFNDSADKMNLSVMDIGGGLAVVSQFTLHANTKKGNRPSYIRAADPTLAEILYNEFLNKIRSEGVDYIEGEFGAYMKIDFVNDGPVTIIIDSKNREL